LHPAVAVQALSQSAGSCAVPLATSPIFAYEPQAKPPETVVAVPEPVMVPPIFVYTLS
jgi:hypothetical protein